MHEHINADKLSDKYIVTYLKISSVNSYKQGSEM